MRLSSAAVLLLAFDTVEGYSTALRPRLAPAGPAVAVASCARRSAEPAMLLSVSQALISVPTLYTLMSVNEYCTHRWYQHEEFNKDHAFQRFCQHVAHFFRKRPLFLAGHSQGSA